MGAVWMQLVLVAVLVLLNAAFAGSELALVSLREAQLRRLEADSARGAALARLARDPNRFLATIQIGITLAGFLASASAAVTLAEPLEGSLAAFLGGAARAVSVVAVTVVLSYLTLVLGELVPKRLAMQRAERWGLVVARPLLTISRVARPAVWVLSRSTDVVVRLLGGDPGVDDDQVTAEELRDLVAAHVRFSAEQQAILDGAFQISDRTVREVYRPRPDVVTLPGEARCGEVRDRLVASGHSRAPVGRGGELDELVGVVHLRDLLADDHRTVESVASPAMVLPESVSVLHALREMQVRHTQLAVVVDEHGAAEGIVTVEDLVEELVGEIQDETDEDVLGVRRETGGAFVVPGRFPVHDLPDIGVVVPDGPYTTVAGLVLDALQQVPERTGDAVVVGDWLIVVTAVGDHAVTEVRIAPRPVRS